MVACSCCCRSQTFKSTAAAVGHGCDFACAADCSSCVQVRSGPSGRLRLGSRLPRCSPSLRLTILGLTILALAALARRELGCACAARDRRSASASSLPINHFGAVGQIGKARGHHAVGGRKPARDHRIVFRSAASPRPVSRVDDIAVADHIAERSRRTALHRGGRHHDRLRQCLDLQAHVDELSGPELEPGVGKFGLEFQRAGGRDRPGCRCLSACRYRSRSRRHCRTHRRPARPWQTAALTRTICCCGRLNCTAIGCNWVMMTRPVVSDAWMMLPWST